MTSGRDTSKLAIRALYKQSKPELTAGHMLLLLLPPQIREYLEKSYTETSGRDTIKLTIRALMETVEASSKNIEIAVMEADGLRILGETSSQSAHESVFTLCV